MGWVLLVLFAQVLLSWLLWLHYSKPEIKYAAGSLGTQLEAASTLSQLKFYVAMPLPPSQKEMPVGYNREDKVVWAALSCYYFFSCQLRTEEILLGVPSFDSQQRDSTALSCLNQPQANHSTAKKKKKKNLPNTTMYYPGMVRSGQGLHIFWKEKECHIQKFKSERNLVSWILPQGGSVTQLHSVA